jgi:hypothetical protein
MNLLLLKNMIVRLLAALQAAYVIPAEEVLGEAKSEVPME